MRIFISYSHRNLRFVDRFVNDLLSQGLSPWLDRRELRVGDSLFERVGNAIAEADVVIPVLTASSIRSRWVRDEIAAAYHKEKTTGLDERVLIPVVAGRFDWPAHLTLLKDRLWLDLTPPNYAGNLSRLIRELHDRGFVGPPSRRSLEKEADHAILPAPESAEMRALVARALAAEHVYPFDGQFSADRQGYYVKDMFERLTGRQPPAWMDWLNPHFVRVYPSCKDVVVDLLLLVTQRMVTSKDDLKYVVAAARSAFMTEVGRSVVAETTEQSSRGYDAAQIEADVTDQRKTAVNDVHPRGVPVWRQFPLIGLVATNELKLPRTIAGYRKARPNRFPGGEMHAFFQPIYEEDAAFPYLQREMGIRIPNRREGLIAVRTLASTPALEDGIRRLISFAASDYIPLVQQGHSLP